MFIQMFFLTIHNVKHLITGPALYVFDLFVPLQFKYKMLFHNGKHIKRVIIHLQQI